MKPRFFFNIYFLMIVAILQGVPHAQTKGHYVQSSTTALPNLVKANETLPDSSQAALLPRIWGVQSFVQRGMNTDPTLREQEYRKARKNLQIQSTRRAAILPRFRMRALFGPAPDISQEVTKEVIDSDTTERIQNKWDFSTIGPYFGSQIEFNQPLNLSRLSSALTAARADLEQLSWDIAGKRVKTSLELQKIYYGMIYAQSMNSLASRALKELNKAMDAIEEKLDEEDETVSQFDLLELKANKFALESALYETEEGMTRAKLGIQFSLGLDNPEIQLEDTIIKVRPEKLPTLDTLKYSLVTYHPDLHRLKHGLKAKRALVNLAAGEMGPGFFIFGQLNYAKSWAGDRTDFEDNVFSQDPLNRVDGALGVGIQYDLNFWSKNDKLKRARIEYNELRKLDYYAEEGLLLRLEEQYAKVIRFKKSIRSAKTSLRASDAWLKGAAMKFDLDPSQAGVLMKAFQKNMMNRKDLYKAIYDYNIALGALIEKTGWTLEQYHSIYINKAKEAK